LQKGLRKIFTVPLYVLGFVLLGLFSGYLAFKILSFSKTVEVPDLRGKTLFEANDLLNKKRLYLKVEGEEYDAVVVSGLIVRQDVPPGNKVKEQRGIKVFLSKGPKVWSIPELSGQTLGEAESLISASGLRIEKIIRVHSPTVEKDTIIAQRPRPDEVMGGGPPQKPEDLLGQHRGLTLIVSSGPYDMIYSCPDFSGKSRDDAVSIAEKLRLKLDFTGSGETVRFQKPKPSSLIRSGETVHIQLEGG
jgi:serine/threonine-protein kinase